jgi:hypothetical protein
MNKLWFLAGFIVILYFLKVPSVVHFIDGILSVVITAWNYMLDVMMHVKDRHPWVWISLPFWLLILMKKD